MTASAIAKFLTTPKAFKNAPKVPMSAKVGPRAFGLRCFGDSMTNPADPRSIPDGSTVVVDPDRQWEVGDNVVVSKRGNDVVLVKRIERAVMLVGEISDRSYLDPKALSPPPRYLLVSLNEKYKPFLMTEEMQILGVVVSIIYNRNGEEEPS